MRKSTKQLALLGAGLAGLLVGSGLWGPRSADIVDGIAFVPGTAQAAQSACPTSQFLYAFGVPPPGGCRFITPADVLQSVAFTKQASARSDNYSATNLDDGSTIYLNASGVGEKTLTIPTLSLLGSSRFSVRACNIDTRPWSLVSTDAGTIKLYPKQCNLLASTGTALVYDRQFQRWNVTTALNIHVGPSGACNDANDGLVTGPTGAICDPQVAFNLIRSDILCQGSNSSVQIKVDDGLTYNKPLIMFGTHPPGCSDQIPITGNADPTKVKLTVPTGQTGFDIEDGMITTISGLSIVCTNATGIKSRGPGAVIDIEGVLINDCTGGSAIVVQDSGHVNVVGAPGLQLLGSAAVGFNVLGTGSLLSIPASAVTVTNSAITITNFLIAANLGEVSAGTIVGGSSLTGTRWLSDNNAVIHGASGSCDGTFPGTINGTASRGGLCN